jgi:hypothetical protein
LEFKFDNYPIRDLIADMKVPYAGAAKLRRTAVSKVPYIGGSRHGAPSEKRIAADFGRIEEAAARGDRCPQNYPDGPLQRKTIPILFNRGMIRSAVYPKNFRVVTILVGPYAGKSTKAHPTAEKPWQVNGVRASWLKD